MIVDTEVPRPDVIGEMDRSATPTQLHEEAIYIQEGSQYQVDRLDWDKKKAYVRPVDVDYYTTALNSLSIKVLEAFAGPDGGDAGGKGLARPGTGDRAPTIPRSIALMAR